MRQRISLIVFICIMWCSMTYADADAFPSNGEWFVFEFGERDAPLEMIKTENGYQDTTFPSSTYLSPSVDLYANTLTLFSTTILRRGTETTEAIYRYVPLSYNSWICYARDVSSLTNRDMVSGFYFENVVDPLDPFFESMVYHFSTEISSHQHKYLLINGQIIPKCNQYDHFYFDGENVYLFEDNAYLSSDLFAYKNEVFILKSTNPFIDEENQIVGSYLFIKERY